MSWMVRYCSGYWGETYVIHAHYEHESINYSTPVAYCASTVPSITVFFGFCHPSAVAKGFLYDGLQDLDTTYAVPLYARPIQKCRIQRVRIRFSPYTNFVRVALAEGLLDLGLLDLFRVTPIPPKF
jgi:hypothetical protein